MPQLGDNILAHQKFNIGTWHPGSAPVAVVMLSLNEGHNMEAVLKNLTGWAHEVFLVDSLSSDDTVDIALKHGVHVVQRRFRGFGDQWNFALQNLPIKAPWTMKLDPDERLSDNLKDEISASIFKKDFAGYCTNIRLFFMGKPLPVRLNLLRLWRTGKARFSDVLANEHALVSGNIGSLSGDIEHHDSPDLDHWLEKQNRYTTCEAIAIYHKSLLSDTPRLFGTKFQRRMWFKKHYFHLPFRYTFIFLYHWIIQGSWRAGWVGYTWARLRADVMRLIEYKYREIAASGQTPKHRNYGCGIPDNRAQQYD
jgi:glycosyltransferase involved in cell wall biosynthesis